MEKPFGGILIMPEMKHKLRITEQIRVLIQNKDSTNIRLGVVVTEDINTTASNKLRTSSIISQHLGHRL
jgi:hypothetical protein